MKNIPISDIKANSYFDAPVYLDEGYILLSPETQVTPELINRLRRWGYQFIYSDGNQKDSPTYLFSVPEGMPTAVLDTDIKEKKRIESAKQFYYSLINLLTESFNKYKEENKLDLSELTEKAKLLIQEIKTNRDSLLRFIGFPYPAGNYLPQHSVNGAILAVTIGELLKLPAHKLIELGTAALLHEIGMLKIPENIPLSETQLTPEQRKMVNAHTILGYRILKGFSVSNEIAVAALEHHERLDGSGYPQGFKSDKIILYARIIAATCSYDAIIMKRPFRDARDGHTALLELLKGSKTLYDENVIRALIYCVSLYPIGSLVLLANNTVARVVKTNLQNPKLPIVQILLDPDRNRVSEQVIIKTSEEGETSVKRSLPQEEIQNLSLEGSR